MEINTDKEYQILYVGGDTKLISSFKKESPFFIINLVENGLEAIQFLKNNPGKIDTIICEDNLPGVNGIELFRMIRQKFSLQTIPFIIIAHDKPQELVNKAIKEKIDDVYSVPLSVEKVFERIKFVTKYKTEYQTEEKEKQTSPEYKIPIIKRAFDIIVSGFTLILLSPLFFIITLAIKIESKGGVFYTSKRVGTGYKIFDFYKFRSMYTGADAKLKELAHLDKYSRNKKEEKEEEEKKYFEQCPRCAKLPDGEYCSPTLYTGGQKICEYWYNEITKHKVQSTFKKIKDDPRVTKIGRIIRNTSIDELPQLFNVLKGDMSIVGNRPLPLYEAELLTSDDWSERFLGPAGITGLWQVELRGKKGEMLEDERKALDNQYARTYSFWGDIKLILRTIPALLQKENV